MVQKISVNSEFGLWLRLLPSKQYTWVRIPAGAFFKMKSIICFVGHCDDGTIGIGGTLAKYAREKYKIIEVIFSYGEISHLRKSVIIRKRISEANKAAKILGYKTIIFFGLPDAGIAKEIDRVRDKIKT